jgi:phospholipase C
LPDSAPSIRIRLALAALLMAVSVAHSHAGTVPHLTRVVVVIMENKSYDEVRTQPYTASLMAEGATLSSSFAVAHPSQPNYLALWAAGTLGNTNDTCPPSGSPFVAENLGHACEAAGLTWRAYSEDLPAAADPGCFFDLSAGNYLYTRKHDPWTDFSNLNHSNERPFGDLLTDLTGGGLPNLAFIVPNNCHNTHDSGTPGCGIPNGDAWLSGVVPPILAALGPTGLLILTWDEDDNSASNHILTVLAGPPVIAGATSAQTISHINVVRTICDGLGLAAFAQAAAASPIDGIWVAPVPATLCSWGSLKLHYH